jgi:hypothetical protein
MGLSLKAPLNIVNKELKRHKLLFNRFSALNPTSQPKQANHQTDAWTKTTAGYDICLEMDVDADTQTVALDAVARRTSIITGDLPSVDSSTITLDDGNQCSFGAPEAIDDLCICICMYMYLYIHPGRYHMDGRLVLAAFLALAHSIISDPIPKFQLRGL